MVCIRQDSAYDRIAKILRAFVWHLAKDLVRTVCVRVKTESVCLVGRTERDGVYARRLGDVERALSGDTRFRPFPSCSVATHHFLMSDPHCMSLSDVGAHRAYHGPYRITSHLRIYHVPAFLDLAYV